MLIRMNGGPEAHVRRVILGEAVELPVDRKCTSIDPFLRERGDASNLSRMLQSLTR